MIKTLTRLRDLKLRGMAAALEDQQNQPGTYDELSFTERLELLLDRECQTREHRKQDRLVRQARFKLRASVQDIDYQHPRNLKKAQVAQLAQTNWLERGQNLLITGHSTTIEPPARGISMRMELLFFSTGAAAGKRMGTKARVQVIIQSNAGNRRARVLAFSHQLGLEFWGVLTAFSVRAGYAYVVHDKCPLRNKWTLIMTGAASGSRWVYRTLTP